MVFIPFICAKIMASKAFALSMGSASFNTKILSFCKGTFILASNILILSFHSRVYDLCLNANTLSMMINKHKTKIKIMRDTARTEEMPGKYVNITYKDW